MAVTMECLYLQGPVLDSLTSSKIREMQVWLVTRESFKVCALCFTEQEANAYKTRWEVEDAFMHAMQVARATLDAEGRENVTSP